MKAERDNPVTFSIWNHHPQTDAGCNEPRDTEWTVRSVRNQVWRIFDGISATRVPRFFEKPLMPEEQTAVEIDYGRFNRYKIVCDHFGYTCYINDKPVQKKLHPLHPLISGAAVQDAEYVYLKLVNVDGAEKEIQITLDCDAEEMVEAEFVQAKPEAVNSFEEKDSVFAVCRTISGGSDFLYRVPEYSVNVLKIRKKKAEWQGGREC